ncbi:hypothetical protein E2C01_051782 [Portunus trituberculatus]|uniref:Uncharacterized protein n=1 Tax=Portunus trituberculatus TaxID=210409 RepID=A0A5B7GMN7_PORTR|nr:hypothetical protein [Portunus trituberculatus]
MWSGVVDKLVVDGSGRRPRVGSNPTTYRFEAMPFVEWFKVSYMSNRKSILDKEVLKVCRRHYGYVIAKGRSQRVNLGLSTKTQTSGDGDADTRDGKECGWTE